LSPYIDGVRNVFLNPKPLYPYIQTLSSLKPYIYQTVISPKPHKKISKYQAKWFGYYMLYGGFCQEFSRNTPKLFIIIYLIYLLVWQGIQ
jgi:hypothetical protein